MTPDEIFAKVTNGELSGEELTNTVSGLEVEQQTELRKKLAEETTKTMTEMSGIRKEKQRVEELLKQRQEELDKEPPKKLEEEPAPSPAPAPQDDFTKQFRNEQKEKAVRKFKSEFGISDEEWETKYRSEFESKDSGKMDADNIYDDIVGVYAFVNKDKLVQADKERQAREAAAAAETAQSAGGPQGAPNDGNEPPKYSEAAQSLAKQAGISEEAAERQITQGTKRVYQ